MPFPVLITLTAQKILDQLLLKNPQSIEKCSELEDKVIKFIVEGVGITAFFLITENNLEILTEFYSEADVTFSGLPSGYIALSKDSKQALVNNEISIKGDFVVGQKFSDLIDSIELDLEAMFSEAIGEDLSQHFFSNKTSYKDKIVNFKINQWQDILHKKLNVLPLANEINDFNHHVETLAKQTSRIEKKLIHCLKRHFDVPV